METSFGLSLLKLLHVGMVGFFAGSLLTMVMVQSLLQRAVDGAERTALARVVSSVGRLVVNPLAYAGFVSGLLYWFARFAQYGIGRLMACTPIHVHIMLTAGLLAVGMAQAWKGRARKIAEALEKKAPASELNAHLVRAWVFAFLALFFVSTAYIVAVLHGPNVISPSCFADSFHN